jgi:RNA polymerase sigma factor (sigma-70 family)
MAQAQLGTVLRHIHRLAGAPFLDDLDDGELLERFTARGEETAFATLVRRHGPVVLGVCRRVLRQRADVEDAFQATFLVLFRRAVALRRSGSLANWLYTVAYHVALRARADGARRQRHERAAPAGRREEQGADAIWSDLQPVLDEELARLPDKYRAPVVLCHLQGKTNEEAARLLGCPAGTVKGRLSRAREMLRARLARRGITLSAAALAAFLAGRAAAAVPAALLAAAVRMTVLVAGGMACPPAAILADGVLRASGPGKLKLVGALLLVVGILVGSAGVLASGGRDRPGVQPTAAPIIAEDFAPAEDPPADAKGKVTVTGQVLDAAGKPMPEARVAVIGLTEPPFRGRVGFRENETLVSGDADKEGRFKLECAAESATRGRFRQVVASAPGHGLGWRLLKRGGDQADLAVKLPPEQVIRGRLIDLQGQGVRGVTLHVARVAPASDDAPDWNCPAWYNFPAAPKRLDAWPAAVVTDAEGRFVVRGLGKDMAATLQVTDEHYAWHEFVVRTTDKGKPEAVEEALEPPHLLEGKVVGEDTRKPVGKVLLRITGRGDPMSREHPELQAWTDEQGRFRANCPPGGLTVFAYPPDGSPYLIRLKTVDWPKGKEKHEIEIGLPRGVIVRGKVTDDSGKAVAGAVIYYYKREDNPFANYTVTSWFHFPGEFVQTKADGTFEATVYPGEGTLLAKGPTRDYLLVKLDTGELALGKKGGAPLYSHAAVSLDLKAGADPQEANLTLKRGVTVRGRVLDPDGKPVKQAVLYHAGYLQDHGDFAFYHHYSPAPVAVKDGRFELPGCDPKAKFPVFVLDARNDIGARAELTVADAKEDVTVRLQPCGKAALRYVGEDGKPQKGHGPGLDFLLDEETYVSLTVADMRGPQFRLPYSDAEGRVTVTGLIPGVKYRYSDGKKTQEFTAESGKSRELPDIVFKLPR